MHHDDAEARQDQTVLAYVEQRPAVWARILAQLAATDPAHAAELTRRAERARAGPQYERR